MCTLLENRQVCQAMCGNRDPSFAMKTGENDAIYGDAKSKAHMQVAAQQATFPQSRCWLLQKDEAADQRSTTEPAVAADAKRDYSVAAQSLQGTRFDPIEELGAEDNEALKRLEILLKREIAFISNYFQNWRFAATLTKELALARANFERNLADEKASMEEKQAKILATWHAGENLGIQRVCVLAWRKIAIHDVRRRLAQHQIEAVGSIISRLAESESQRLVQTVFSVWWESNLAVAVVDTLQEEENIAVEYNRTRAAKADVSKADVDAKLCHEAEQLDDEVQKITCMSRRMELQNGAQTPGCLKSELHEAVIGPLEPEMEPENYNRHVLKGDEPEALAELERLAQEETETSIKIEEGMMQGQCCDVEDFQQQQAKDAASVVTFLKANGYSGVNARRTSKLKSKYPLHTCVKQRNVWMARLLLEAGADPLLKDSFGQSAKTLAAKSKNDPLIALFFADRRPSDTC